MACHAQAQAPRGGVFLQASVRSFALLLHFLVVTLFVNGEGGAAQTVAQQEKHACCRLRCEQLVPTLGVDPKPLCRQACDLLINSTSKGHCAGIVAEEKCTNAPMTAGFCKKYCASMFDDCNACANGYEEDVTLYNASACSATPVEAEECREDSNGIRTSCYTCTCRPCPAGWYCAQGSISHACPQGTYQAQTKQSSQESCIASVMKCSQERAKKEGGGTVDLQFLLPYIT